MPNASIRINVQQPCRASDNERKNQQKGELITVDSREALTSTKNHNASDKGPQRKITYRQLPEGELKKATGPGGDERQRVRSTG